MEGEQGMLTLFNEGKWNLISENTSNWEERKGSSTLSIAGSHFNDDVSVFWLPSGKDMYIYIETHHT